MITLMALGDKDAEPVLVNQEAIALVRRNDSHETVIRFLDGSEILVEEPIFFIADVLNAQGGSIRAMDAMKRIVPVRPWGMAME